MKIGRLFFYIFFINFFSLIVYGWQIEKKEYVLFTNAKYLRKFLDNFLLVNDNDEVYLISEKLVPLSKIFTITTSFYEILTNDNKIYLILPWENKVKVLDKRGRTVYYFMPRKDWSKMIDFPYSFYFDKYNNLFYYNPQTSYVEKLFSTGNTFKVKRIFLKVKKIRSLNNKIFICLDRKSRLYEIERKKKKLLDKVLDFEVVGSYLVVLRKLDNFTLLNIYKNFDGNLKLLFNDKLDDNYKKIYCSFFEKNDIKIYLGKYLKVLEIKLKKEEKK